MPKDDKNKPAAKTAATTQDEAIQGTTDSDPRDAEIASLEKKLSETERHIELQNKHLADAAAEIASLEKKLAEVVGKLAASSQLTKLEDMTACVNGKLVRIRGTVEAKFASDDVKKGYIDEDLQLLIPER